MMIDKDEAARMILSVSQACADGYKRNISQSNTEHENDVAEKCAIAASNTGRFLLQALGYSSEEIKSIVAGQASRDP